MYPVKKHKITCAYGRKGGWKCGYHCGVDMIPTDADYNIYAPVKAIVFTAKKNHKSYGNYVVLKHGDGHFSRYAHLESIFVEKGRKVSEGDVLGVMGSTGNSTGRHLHWEVHRGTSMAYPANTDPMKYIEPTDIAEIAKGLAERGIVSDTAGLVEEVKKEPCGRLYWVCRKALAYIRKEI